MPTIDEAINAIKKGNKEEGRQLLEQAVDEDENNEQIWLWMSVVVDADEDREICLENVLAINPDHEIAAKALKDLREGTFDPADITGKWTKRPDHSDEAGLSFHDEFFSAAEADDFAEDDIVWPSVLGGDPKAAKATPKKETKKSGLPLKLDRRMILLAAFGLLVCLALGSAATYNMFLAGDGGSTEGQPTQNNPEGGAEGVPTETLTPEPTPTPTNTPFILPTAKPTDPPTPTATQVVSPTPPLPTATPEANSDG